MLPSNVGPPNRSLTILVFLALVIASCRLAMGVTPKVWAGPIAPTNFLGLLGLLFAFMQQLRVANEIRDKLNKLDFLSTYHSGYSCKCILTALANFRRFGFRSPCSRANTWLDEGHAPKSPGIPILAAFPAVDPRFLREVAAARGFG